MWFENESKFSVTQTDQLSYADSRSSSHFFKFFKSLKKNSELPAVMKWGQKSVSSTPEAGESFNKCFQSVFATPSDLTNFYGCENFLLDDNNITLEKISNFMQCLDVSKSKGHDCLPPVLFKRMDTLKTSIYGLFRTIKRTCTFPSFWKIGNVKPLFKKSNRALVTNYTPITLLCILSKIFEKWIFDSLYSFAAPLLHSSQFGFTKGKSTIIQLLCYLDEINKNVQLNDICVEALYLHFWKGIRQNWSCHSDREAQVNWSLWEVIEYIK